MLPLFHSYPGIMALYRLTDEQASLCRVSIDSMANRLEYTGTPLEAITATLVALQTPISPIIEIGDDMPSTSGVGWPD